MRAAQRFNDAVRAEERLAYIGALGEKLYTWAGVPDAPRVGALICSSLSAEFVANYHRERELGYALVERGIAVVRFHYRGEGNSDGDTSDVTFLSMSEDAESARSYLRSITGTGRVAVVGSRLGALIAAGSVGAGEPLVLWEPVDDPIRFIAEAARARRMSDLRAVDEAEQRTGWREELAEHGVLDLLGYQIHPKLVESLDGRTIANAATHVPSRTLVAGFGSRKSRASKVAEILSAAGHAVDRQEFSVAESWWFHSERLVDDGNLVPATAEWIAEQLGMTSTG